MRHINRELEEWLPKMVKMNARALAAPSSSLRKGLLKSCSKTAEDSLPASAAVANTTALVQAGLNSHSVYKLNPTLDQSCMPSSIAI
jgi:hypothetical protein